MAGEFTETGVRAQNLAPLGNVWHVGAPMGVVTRSARAPVLDELVLARARAGDDAALEKLFRHFEAPIYTLARRLTRTPHDAEDVLQETFLEVVRSISRFRGDGSFAGWIRRVAASKALMRLRAREARPVEDELSEEIADSSPAPMATTAEKLDLEAALARLTDTARAVIWLHDVEGYSHDEIAAMMGKTPSFSKSQLARAHARLRVLLAPPAEDVCT